jgi:cell division protein ZipA
LRWILLGFGIALLAAIYLWGRRSRPAAGDKSHSPVVSPARFEPDYRELEIPPHLRNHEAPAVAEPPNSYADATEPLDEQPESAFGPGEADEAARPEVAASPAASQPPPDFVDLPTFVPETRPAVPMSALPRARREPSLGPLSDAPAVRERPPPLRRMESGLGLNSRSSDPAETPGPAEAPASTSTSDPSPSRESRRKIFAVRLVAPTGQRYPGRALLAQLVAERLQHGRYGIFHLLDSSGESVFSVASMVEPGSFDLDAMSECEFAGLTLFTLLPGPRSGTEAVSAMIACAGRLQQSLGGALQDERGMPLRQAYLESMGREAALFKRGGGSAPSPAAI